MTNSTVQSQDVCVIKRGNGKEAGRIYIIDGIEMTLYRAQEYMVCAGFTAKETREFLNGLPTQESRFNY